MNLSDTKLKNNWTPSAQDGALPGRNGVSSIATAISAARNIFGCLLLALMLVALLPFLILLSLGVAALDTEDLHELKN